MNCSSLSVMRCGIRRPKPMAPRRRCAVVSGSSAKERTPVLAQALHEFRITVFFRGVADDERFLRLPHPAGGMAVDGSFRAGGFIVRDAGLEDVQAHDVADGIVQGERKEIEIDDRVQASGEVVEKRGKVALLGDGLADFQHGFELLARVFRRRRGRRFRRGNDRVRHNRQDSTRVGSGSTAGTRGGRPRRSVDRQRFSSKSYSPKRGFYFFGGSDGRDGSPTQAGASLAGNDSSDASSTASVGGSPWGAEFSGSEAAGIFFPSGLATFNDLNAEYRIRGTGGRNPYCKPSIPTNGRNARTRKGTVANME